MAPVVHAVQTRAPSGHFVTTSKQELKSHSGYRKPLIDSIPYP